MFAFLVLALSPRANAVPACQDSTICTPLVATDGDYELAVDPLDDKVLLLTNVGSSCSNWPPLVAEEVWPPTAAYPGATAHSVRLRRLDTTGATILNTMRLGDYAGCAEINGAEFILPYGGLTTLRVVWRDVDGMRLSMRPDGAAWNAFGAPQYFGPESVYPSSNLFAYATDVGYGAFAGDPTVTTICEADLATLDPGACYGTFLNEPTVTEKPASLDVYAQALHPTRLGVVAVTGCTFAGVCGLAFAETDIVNGGVLSAAMAIEFPDPREWRETLRGAAFPDPALAREDEDVIWFTTEEGAAASADIHVFVETAAGSITEPTWSPVTPPVSGPIEHVAVATGEDEVVMYYQVRDGANQGNYRMIVQFDGTDYVMSSPPEQFSDCSHAVEVIHTTSAGWLSYEDSDGATGRKIYRCEQPW